MFNYRGGNRPLYLGGSPEPHRPTATGPLQRPYTDSGRGSVSPPTTTRAPRGSVTFYNPTSPTISVRATVDAEVQYGVGSDTTLSDPGKYYLPCMQRPGVLVSRFHSVRPLTQSVWTKGKIKIYFIDVSKFFWDVWRVLNG